MEHFALRLPEAQIELITRVAKERGASTAAVVRGSLEIGLPQFIAGEREPCACGNAQPVTAPAGELVGPAGEALARIASAESVPTMKLARHDASWLAKAMEARAAFVVAMQRADDERRRAALRAGDVVLVRVHGAAFRLPGRAVTRVRPMELVSTRVGRTVGGLELYPLGGPLVADTEPGLVLTPGDHRIPTCEWIVFDEEPSVTQALADGRLEIVEILKAIAPKAPRRIATAEDLAAKRVQLERRDRELRKRGRCIDEETGEECELVSVQSPETNEWIDVSPAEAARMRQETRR